MNDSSIDSAVSAAVLLRSTATANYCWCAEWTTGALTKHEHGSVFPELPGFKSRFWLFCCLSRDALDNPLANWTLLSLNLSSFFSVLAFLPSRFFKMPVTASRAFLRQSQFLTRRTAVRHASSTSETASKASESASSAASKASEGLSRVSSSAGPAIGNAAQGVGNALKKVGGRTGKVISFVECKQKLFSGYFRMCYFRSLGFSMGGGSGGCYYRSPCHSSAPASLMGIAYSNAAISGCTWLTICFSGLAMIPPTVYYSRVGLELGKLVFRGQNMSPP